MRVCGTFVLTNSTAPHSSKMSTRTQFDSAYFPIHATYPDDFLSTDGQMFSGKKRTHNRFQSFYNELIYKAAPVRDNPETFQKTRTFQRNRQAVEWTHNFPSLLKYRIQFLCALYRLLYENLREAICLSQAIAKMLLGTELSNSDRPTGARLWPSLHTPSSLLQSSILYLLACLV
jgi:hypothetical protein